MWKQDKPPRPSFNAHSEEVADKPMWRKALRTARCLVPAEGWYEWRTAQRAEPGRDGMKAFKQPYYLHKADGSLFAFAGLWSLWRASAQHDPAALLTLLRDGADNTSSSLPCRRA